MNNQSETQKQQRNAVNKMIKPGKPVLQAMPSRISAMLASRIKLQPAVRPVLKQSSSPNTASVIGTNKAETTPANEPQSIPSAAASNPFQELPFPSPGDRIKADDFKKLSSSLVILHDMSILSSALFGQTFGDIKPALAMQNYVVESVLTVFGTELQDSENSALDNRKVLQAIPVELGSNRLLIVVSEAVEMSRLTPNLIGLTYQDAMEKLRALMGDVTFPQTDIQVQSLVGQTLNQARDVLVNS
jgi:hypothetical protein